MISHHMHRPGTTWPVAVALAMFFSAACRPAAEPSPSPNRITQARQAGSWEGTGNKTIGFVSESGVFRLNWKTRNERPAGSGTFRLTVRSAISGRPIRVVADQHGEGSGTVDFVDDPRMYDFMVDSANIEWTFHVEEIGGVAR